MEQTIYEKRVLAFVDLLGFKNTVRLSVDSIGEQCRIMRAVRLIHNRKKLNDFGFDGKPESGLTNLGIQVTTFSDCAVISYPLSYDGGLFSILIDIIHLQIDLIGCGFFIRGGISIDLAYHDSSNVYGPALINSYMLESTKAIYPRIILSRETVEEGIKYAPTHQNKFDIGVLYSLLKKDEDGWYFLDYLSQHQELDNPKYDYYPWLRKIRAYLVKALNQYHTKESVEIYKKYIWLLHYWNKTLSEKESFPFIAGMSESETIEAYKSLPIEISPPYK